MTLKPCLVCGEPAANSRCDEHRPKRPAKDLPRRHPHMNGAQWKRLSASARRRQPWCLDCGAVNDLTTDHIIPIHEAPELAYEPANIAVRCRPCNSARGTHCTHDERQAVYAALTRGGAPKKGAFRRGGKARGALHTAGGIH
ncbi:HNH endonuclease [Mycobacterium kansasii]|nr:HNH endonuclease [Mycobacterium kansasii]POX98431.1 HNH endonuclease [Mycobacterium kansasii]POY20183.1 HNH endonuclease [Mycobacterium kansasii]